MLGLVGVRGEGLPWILVDPLLHRRRSRALIFLRLMFLLFMLFGRRAPVGIRFRGFGDRRLRCPNVDTHVLHIKRRPGTLASVS